MVMCIDGMQGGEIFIPKIPSMRIVDLARALAPGCQHEIVGIRPGEKLHEVLLTEEESRLTLEFETYYVIKPPPLNSRWNADHLNGGTPVKEGFQYSSDNNPTWLSEAQLFQMMAEEDLLH